MTFKKKNQKHLEKTRPEAAKKHAASWNKKTVYVLMLMLFLFCGLVLYFSYFQIFKSSELAGAGNNPRTYAREQSIKRGSIYDRNHTCLAYSEMGDGKQTRIYPMNRLYAQLIGFSHPRFGRTQLENTFNTYLSGSANTDILDALLGTSYTSGGDLQLTVDNELSLLAADLLGAQKGAIVAMNPKTGEILAMVSKPWFNPNTLDENWEDLNAEDGVFVPRATSGLYPPGSSFKIITAAAAVENDMDDIVYEDTGSYTVEGHSIYNYNKKEYGTLDIETAFAKSSNTYFAMLAETLGEQRLRKTAESFYFNQNIPFDIPLSQSTLLKSREKTNVAAVGYGQGDTLTTPLHMAMVASSIANDGVMMQPYVVQRATTPDGDTAYEARTKVLKRTVSAYTAQRVGEMMQKCVTEGTGSGAQIAGIRVAGKTGTAEVGGEKGDHAWFVSYAPADNPQIAVAIVLENAGQTGSVCAPMAAQLIQKWLNQ